MKVISIISNVLDTLSFKKSIILHGVRINLLVGFFINIFINMGVAVWMLFLNGFKPLPLYGHISISQDIIGMAFTLTLCVTWFNILTTREEIQAYPQRLISNPRMPIKLLMLLPGNRVLRTLFLSIFFTLVCLPTIPILFYLGVRQMDGLHFILFKSIYSGFLALPVIFISSYSVYVRRN
ncbi:MAG: hypothetical protein PHV30_09960 [Candidatus Margulisbacteria bacterium]|nr:hypothetical protein [Candidatus Margulisiibacteriota bacterium]